MSSALPELQAMQAVKRLHLLTGQVSVFTRHAKLLAASSKSFDAVLLYQQADLLLKNLTASRADFQSIKAVNASLTHALSSRPPAAGGLSPAAKWRPELNAASKQFLKEVQDAEAAVKALYKQASISMNVPTRTATSPDGLFDVLLNIIQFVTDLREFAKKRKT